MSSPGAVVIGDALIDEIRDGAGVRELVGGAALNVAVGLRRLGIPATLIAMVGDDVAGSHIREYLSDHGVTLLASDAPQGSSRAIVTRTSGGEPTYGFNPAAQRRSIRFDERMTAAIADADLVVISCFPFDVPAEAAALADAVAGARLVIDPNPRTGMLSDRAGFVRGFEQLAVSAELVKVGSDDASVLYGTDIDRLGEHLRGLGVPTVLTTAGADGAAIETGALRVDAPITELPGRIVDTVGAGDATLAAVAAGLVAGAPEDAAAWRALLDRAMAVAAATCRTEGGLLRTPESLTPGDGVGLST